MNIKKNLIFTIFFIIFLQWNHNSYCSVSVNDICEGFPSPESDNIENSVIEGSALFFQGMSDIMDLFDEIEKGTKDRNFPNSINIIDSAIIKLKSAQEKYNSAIQIAKSVDKSMCSFKYLEKFDYNGFVEKNGFIPDIAEEAKQYLSAGDVAGFYQKIITDIDSLVKNLKILKEKLNVKVNLYQEDYWLILQQCSRLMLFGNYGTVMGKNAYNTIN